MREKRKKLSPFKERISTSFEANGWASSFLAFGWVKGTNSNQFCNFPCLAKGFKLWFPTCGTSLLRPRIQISKFELSWLHTCDTRRACRVWAFGLLGLQFTRATGEWRLMGLGFYSALGRVTWPSGLMCFCLETFTRPISNEWAGRVWLMGLFCSSWKSKTLKKTHQK